MKPLILALALLAGALSPPRVAIRLSSPVVMADHSETVYCRVSPHEDNRWLEIGIENYRLSGVSLEGADSASIFSVQFLHVPCEAGVAFCRLTTVASETKIATLPLTLAGCHD